MNASRAFNIRSGTCLFSAHRRRIQTRCRLKFLHSPTPCPTTTVTDGYSTTAGQPRREDFVAVLDFMGDFLEDFAINASLRFMTAASRTSQSMS